MVNHNFLGLIAPNGEYFVVGYIEVRREAHGMGRQNVDTTS